MRFTHIVVMQVRPRYGVCALIIVEGEAAVVVWLLGVRLGVVREEVVFEGAPEVNETLLIFNVVRARSDAPRLSVRPQTPVVLLLQVLLHLQVVERVRQVRRDGSSVRGVEGSRVVRVVRLEDLLLLLLLLLVLIIHVF